MYHGLIPGRWRRLNVIQVIQESLRGLWLFRVLSAGLSRPDAPELPTRTAPGSRPVSPATIKYYEILLILEGQPFKDCSGKSPCTAVLAYGIEIPWRGRLSLSLSLSGTAPPTSPFRISSGLYLLLSLLSPRPPTSSHPCPHPSDSLPRHCCFSGWSKFSFCGQKYVKSWKDYTHTHTHTHTSKLFEALSRSILDCPSRDVVDMITNDRYKLKKPSHPSTSMILFRGFFVINDL
jgi:hypothetical protein